MRCERIPQRRDEHLIEPTLQYPLGTSLVTVKEVVRNAARARCVCWGDFVGLPTCSTVKCMCFHAAKGVAIAHTALCPLTVSLTVSFLASCGQRCRLHPIKWRSSARGVLKGRDFFLLRTDLKDRP